MGAVGAAGGVGSGVEGVGVDDGVVAGGVAGVGGGGVGVGGGVAGVAAGVARTSERAGAGLSNTQCAFHCTHRSGRGD